MGAINGILMGVYAVVEGERPFHCGIVPGKKSSSWHHCMSGIYNIGHCVMTS